MGEGIAKVKAMATIGDLMFGRLEFEARKGGGIPTGIPENSAVASVKICGKCFDGGNDLRSDALVSSVTYFMMIPCGTKEGFLGA